MWKINRRSETWCVHLERYLLVNVSIFVPQLILFIETWSSKFVLFESTSRPTSVCSVSSRRARCCRAATFAPSTPRASSSQSRMLFWNRLFRYLCRRWSARFGSVSILHSVVSELVDAVDDNFQSDFTIATRVACALLDVVVIWSLVGSSIFAITRCGGRDSAAASSTEARTTEVREQEPRSTQTNLVDGRPSMGYSVACDDSTFQALFVHELDADKLCVLLAVWSGLPSGSCQYVQRT
jgi:hypothetical protein